MFGEHFQAYAALFYFTDLNPDFKKTHTPTQDCYISLEVSSPAVSWLQRHLGNHVILNLPLSRKACRLHLTSSHFFFFFTKGH